MMGRALLGALVLAWMATAGWSQSITWLGTLGGSESEAWDVSANGVVVGRARNVVSWRAFRWTAAEGMQDIASPIGGDGVAYGISPDGSVVVGEHNGRAFLWTASSRLRELGRLPGGNWSEAWDVTDGSVVVGRATNAAGQWRAVRWTASGGIEDLNTTYASLLTNGSVLQEARAISPDGRYIVGRGYNAATNRNEAFLLDTRCTLVGDVNGDEKVDDADLLIVLFNFGRQCRQ
jgi:uncharacterized membrane protein